MKREVDRVDIHMGAIWGYLEYFGHSVLHRYRRLASYRFHDEVW